MNPRKANGSEVTDDDFLTLAGTGEAETRVKASVFLAYAAPVATEPPAPIDAGKPSGVAVCQNIDPLPRPLSRSNLSD